MRTEYSVNDMTIHRLVEQEQGFTPMLEFLPNLAKETLEANLSWLAPGGYNRDTGNVVLCYQSYVVKTPHHNILVDACIGNERKAIGTGDIMHISRGERYRLQVTSHARYTMVCSTPYLENRIDSMTPEEAEQARVNMKPN